jgi:DNA-binding MarR family transcriptional regulator
LAQGNDGTLQSPSEVFQSVVASMVNSSWSEDQMFAALTDPSNAGGASMRRRKHQRAYLRRSVQKASARRSPTHAGTSRVRLDQLEARVFSSPWPGRAGATDQRILAAMVAVAKRKGSATVSFSARQLAEAAGTSKTTAHAATVRLERSGWVQRGTSTEGQSARFALRTPMRTNRETQDLHTGGVCERRMSRVVRTHDAFRSGALGPRAAQIFDLLTGQPLSTGDLTRTLGIGPRAAQKQLTRLSEHGLVRRLGDSWLANPAMHLLDEIATKYGTNGAGERQRTQHEKDRRAFATMRAAREEQRMVANG